MNRIRYTALLDEIRHLDLEQSQPMTLLEDAVVPTKRESRARLKVRLTEAQRAFIDDSVKSTRGTAIDASALVALAIRIVEELEVPWDSISTRDDLVSVVRRALQGRRS